MDMKVLENLKIGGKPIPKSVVEELERTSDIAKALGSFMTAPAAAIIIGREVKGAVVNLKEVEKKKEEKIKIAEDAKAVAAKEKAEKD